MSPVKERLIKKIRRMSEAEARRMLDLVLKEAKATANEAILLKLAQDPTFVVPKPGARRFQKVKPARGKGIPASELLIRDRR